MLSSFGFELKAAETQLEREDILTSAPAFTRTSRGDQIVVPTRPLSRSAPNQRERLSMPFEAAKSNAVKLGRKTYSCRTRPRLIIANGPTYEIYLLTVSVQFLVYCRVGDSRTVDVEALQQKRGLIAESAKLSQGTIDTIIASSSYIAKENMSELQLWDAVCKAWGLHVNQGKFIDILRKPSSSKQDADLVQQLKEVAENIEIRNPEVNWSAIPALRFGGHLKYTSFTIIEYIELISASLHPLDSVLVQTLDGKTNAETPQVFHEQNSSECSQEEKTFSIPLYAIILRSCRQNSWLGQSVEKINFHIQSCRRGPFIGSSNFGSVNILYDTANKMVFAEKRCTLPHGRPALANEKSLLKRLDHIHIVRFIGSSYEAFELSVIMEYVSGGTVEGMVKTLGKIPEDDARAVARQVLDGLRYLHSQDPPVVHRDIKGANLLITLHGCVKIADLGLVKPLLENTRTFAGIVPWMAPEIINNTNHGTRVDVWSFGCTIIEMLCGGHPWTREGLGHFDAMKRITAFNMPIPDSISLELQDIFAHIFVASDERKSVSDLWMGCDWIWTKKNKQT
ncbi:kinase-like protein [Guyanagaster necrorhizus]|uniref:Kinase-like protein n=1 Tax=Guyanagaster necrorhizus TaxID=856835 RepID=A0A9P7VRB9_9AGAR|nr:kinase-like protein [Guyanagaster necrorhizus MCA 3950]KAG7445397.1 kinase-like protein [Guyanagaster necrorhizus MCA 3950]